jgi:hypothetical protein
MGEYALHELGLERGSFDLDVTHQSPSEVQGLSSATAARRGVSTVPSHAQSEATPLSATICRSQSALAPSVEATLRRTSFEFGAA